MGIRHGATRLSPSVAWSKKNARFDVAIGCDGRSAAVQSKGATVKRTGRRRKEAKVDAAEEAQVCKIELPRSSALVEGEKKQKVENEKAFAEKEGRGRW